MEKARLFVFFLVISFCLSLTLQPSMTYAEYPDKPVTLLLPFPAGGHLGVAARLLAESAKEFFPKPLTIVAKPGGSGTIAIAELFQAKPDGYTLSLCPAGPFCIQPHRTKLPYKSPADFTPILKIFSVPLNLVVNTSFPANTLDEFIAYAKANPGKLKISHTGLGTYNHINLENLKSLAKIDVVVAPAIGASEAMPALLGGHIDAFVTSYPDAIPFIKANRIKTLVSFTKKRFPLFPDVPTALESGFDISYGAYDGIVGPKGLPPDIKTIVHNVMKKAMESPVFQTPMMEHGNMMTYAGPEDFMRELMADYEEGAKIVERYLK